MKRESVMKSRFAYLLVVAFAMLPFVPAPARAQGVVRSLDGQTGHVTLVGTNGLSASASHRTVTVTSNATPFDAANTIVLRDGSGDFFAGTVGLSGNLALPNTTASAGAISLGGILFLHNFGGNTFLGAGAGNTTMTGHDNTGVGTNALFSNTRGGFNSAFGEFALFSNTTGFINAAFGQSALAANTTGVANSAFGNVALAANTTGGNNAAFGINALASNTTAFFNSAFGGDALGLTTTGGGNSAFGDDALAFNTTGEGNAAFGLAALQNLASGSFNTAIGNGAGSLLTTGSNNIYIGSGFSGSASESTTIRIGTVGIQTTAFMAGIFGATSASGVPVFIDALGQLGTTTSSRRFKDEIAAMGTESDVLMKLHPVAFYYRPEVDATHTRQYGLVAEEVAEVAPQLVLSDKDGAPQTVRYHFVNAMLLNEVQKQRTTIVGQESKIQDLEARLARLEAILARDR
jgi:hypothetical protein